jgi:nucleoside-diphosphate kinase
LIDYLAGSGNPVICMCWQGSNAVVMARKIIGSTDPGIADPGSIRSDLAVIPGRNVIHGSDSPESADRELRLWFGFDDEVIDWTPVVPQVANGR